MRQFYGLTIAYDEVGSCNVHFHYIISIITKQTQSPLKCEKSIFNNNKSKPVKLFSRSIFLIDYFAVVITNHKFTVINQMLCWYW